MPQARLGRASRCPPLCPRDVERKTRRNRFPSLGTNRIVRRPHNRHVVSKIRAIFLMRWQCGPVRTDSLGYISKLVVWLHNDDQGSRPVLESRERQVDRKESLQ